MTPFFSQLIDAETHVRSHFITFPSKVSGKGYSRKELSQFDAYALLVHAEIEAYFENCVTQIVDVAERKLKKDQYNRALYCLGAFYAREGQDGESILKVPQKDIWREKGGRGIRGHRDAIRNNNGIKSDDLCRLLIPIGIDVRNVDQVLFVELEQLGKMRGSTAHSSLRARRWLVIDPHARVNEIQNLIGLLKEFDRLYSKFLQQQKGSPRRPRKKH